MTLSEGVLNELHSELTTLGGLIEQEAPTAEQLKVWTRCTELTTYLLGILLQR